MKPAYQMHKSAVRHLQGKKKNFIIINFSTNANDNMNFGGFVCVKSMIDSHKV